MSWRLLQAEAWEAQAREAAAQRKRSDGDHAVALNSAQAEVQVCSAHARQAHRLLCLQGCPQTASAWICANVPALMRE